MKVTIDNTDTFIVDYGDDDDNNVDDDDGNRVGKNNKSDGYLVVGCFFTGCLYSQNKSTHNPMVRFLPRTAFLHII